MKQLLPLIQRYGGYLLWLFAAILFLFPLNYFAQHLNNEAFLAATMGNWFATIMGVVAGVPIALAIARYQQLQQQKAEVQERRHQEEQALDTILERLRLELGQNRQRLDRLQSALTESPESRVDLWAWAITIADSLTSEAYSDLSRSGLQTRVPRELSLSLYLCYANLIGLVYRVREADAAHRFYTGYKSDQQSASQGHVFVQSLTREVIRMADSALKELAQHKLYTDRVSKRRTA